MKLAPGITAGPFSSSTGSGSVFNSPFQSINSQKDFFNLGPQTNIAAGPGSVASNTKLGASLNNNNNNNPNQANVNNNVQNPNQNSNNNAYFPDNNNSNNANGYPVNSGAGNAGQQQNPHSGIQQGLPNQNQAPKQGYLQPGQVLEGFSSFPQTSLFGSTVGNSEPADNQGPRQQLGDIFFRGQDKNPAAGLLETGLFGTRDYGQGNNAYDPYADFLDAGDNGGSSSQEMPSYYNDNNNNYNNDYDNYKDSAANSNYGTPSNAGYSNNDQNYAEPGTNYYDRAPEDTSSDGSYPSSNSYDPAYDNTYPSGQSGGSDGYGDPYDQGYDQPSYPDTYPGSSQYDDQGYPSSDPSSSTNSGPTSAGYDPRESLTLENGAV
nr:hypothetical protein BaRGS_004852 [Batillaria attramentaria]